MAPKPPPASPPAPPAQPPAPPAQPPVQVVLQLQQALGISPRGSTMTPPGALGVTVGVASFLAAAYLCRRRRRRGAGALLRADQAKADVPAASPEPRALKKVVREALQKHGLAPQRAKVMPMVTMPSGREGTQEPADASGSLERRRSRAASDYLHGRRRSQVSPQDPSGSSSSSGLAAEEMIAPSATTPRAAVLGATCERSLPRRMHTFCRPRGITHGLMKQANPTINLLAVDAPRSTGGDATGAAAVARARSAGLFGRMMMMRRQRTASQEVATAEEEQRQRRKRLDEALAASDPTQATKGRKKDSDRLRLIGAQPFIPEDVEGEARATSEGNLGNDGYAARLARTRL